MSKKADAFDIDAWDDDIEIISSTKAPPKPVVEQPPPVPSTPQLNEYGREIQHTDIESLPVSFGRGGGVAEDFEREREREKTRQDRMAKDIEQYEREKRREQSANGVSTSTNMWRAETDREWDRERERERERDRRHGDRMDRDESSRHRDREKHTRDRDRNDWENRDRKRDAPPDDDLDERAKRRRLDADALRDASGKTIIERQNAKMRQITAKHSSNQMSPAEAKKMKKLRGRRDMETMSTTVHWSEKTLDAMTERDWRIFKEDFMVTTKGTGVPMPMRCWKESALPVDILRAIDHAGYKDPSPVQMQCIPIALTNRDVIGVAQTGSGKTAAFVIPMCVYIAKQPKLVGERILDGPYAIVLAPTRELAQQIEDEAYRFCHYMQQRVISVVGGINLEEQAMRIRHGAELIIGTPGRMTDCIDRKFLVLNQCNYVVLDEADRMIDMGFEPQVNQVLEGMPATNLRPEDETLEDEDQIYRQTFMFSATMPAAVEKIAQKYMRRPVVCTIGEVGTPIDKIEQVVEWASSENAKRTQLQNLLHHAEPPIIVFANTREKVENLAKVLESEGHSTAVLHGNKSQDQRQSALDGFKNRRTDILVATDVAARGIDVRNVTHVVNYDAPKTIEYYTHRIGRTGRAGSKGKAVTFITAQDTDIMFDLVTLLKSCKANIPKELANNDASRAKPGTLEFAQKKRKDTVIYAKKTQ